VFSFRYLLLQHGYALLFAYVLIVSLGLPIPVDPLFLLMGAMVGNHRYGFFASLFAALLPALVGDLAWYQLGRLRGRSILGLLCKLSIEPDTCVRNTEESFSKRGDSALLISKFLPGMSLVSVTLAGVSGMPFRRFLLLDTIGCAVWAGGYLLIGEIFYRQVDLAILWLGLLGRRAGVTVLALIALYLAYKYCQRWRFLHNLRTDRITPEQLQELLKTCDSVSIIDLRHPSEVETEGLKIPNAIVVRPDDLRLRAHEIPREREVILYCTCPNESTSAKMALQLKSVGIPRVRPLAGGFEAWRDLGFPTEPVEHSSPVLPSPVLTS
jgi:membrane protein DedA with SNARE-associated domain/rhodanese-related sulfurtransferase